MRFKFTHSRDTLAGSPWSKQLPKLYTQSPLGQYCQRLGKKTQDHHISCCPSLQLPRVTDAARASVIQAAVPLKHLVLTWSDPGPPGQPQEQNLVDDSHEELELKPQLEPRDSVAKEEDLKPSHQWYKLQIKSTWSTRQTLCLWNK